MFFNTSQRIPLARSEPLAILGRATLPQRNRLTVAHLLLWMTTTGIALVYFQSQRPPPVESIGFASFLSQPGAAGKAAMAKARQHLWRTWNRGYHVGLIASPIYGAALAGIGLALWRFMTQRNGFPTQPGHWLLLEIGVLAGLVATRDQWHWLRMSPDAGDFVLTSLMMAAVAAAAIAIKPGVWRLSMLTATCGFLIVCAAYVISFCSSSIEPPALFGVGLLVIAAVPFLILAAIASDLADRKRYDIFHWIGVAVFLGVIGHLLGLDIAARL